MKINIIFAKNRMYMETGSSMLEKYVYLLQIFNNAGDKGLSIEEVESKWKARYGTFQARTFHRQREALPSIFPVSIKCSNESGKYRYYISHISEDQIVRKTTAAWTNSFLVNKKLSKNIQLADRIRMSPEYGNDNIAIIADAISMSNTLKFTYTRDNSFKRHLNIDPNTFNIDEDKRDEPIYKPEELEDIVADFEVSPYFLVFETRWFLIGAEGEEKFPTVFCLDRLSNITITDNTFIPEIDLPYEKVRENVKVLFRTGVPYDRYDDRLMYIMALSHTASDLYLL